MLQYRLKAKVVRLLILVPIVFISFGGFSQKVEYRNYDRYDDTYIIGGAKVTYSDKVSDTITMTDDETGEISIQINNSGGNIKTLNGKLIRQATVDEHGTHPETIAKSMKKFSVYLTKGVRNLLEELKDGEYTFCPDYPTIDEQGSVAYFEMWGLVKTAKVFPGATAAQMKASQYIDPALKKQIDNKVIRLMLGAPKFDVLYENGKPVPYSIGGFSVKVKGHRVKM